MGACIHKQSAESAPHAACAIAPRTTSVSSAPSPSPFASPTRTDSPVSDGVHFPFSSTVYTIMPHARNIVHQKQQQLIGLIGTTPMTLQQINQCMRIVQTPASFHMPIYMRIDIPPAPNARKQYRSTL